MRIFLIRHGDSTHGQLKRLLAPEQCPGLSALGRQQAEKLAQRLKNGGEASDCARLLCSPYTRTRQTAEALLPALAVSQIEVDSRLAEIHYGEAIGLEQAEFRARYPSFNWGDEPDRPVAPGGESWNDFLHRVEGTMTRLAAETSRGSVVAATHAGFIVVAFLALFGLQRVSGPRAWIDPLHASLTEWDYQDGQWRLARYNDSAHLL